MTIFFSGIGGAGTLPLALILDGMGHQIAWSDRAHDSGQLPEKFAWLKAKWPRVWPQDGSGLRALQHEIEYVLPSGSVEDKVPDIQTARELNLPIIKRPELLAKLFNAAPRPIGIAGTSGKTTTTGMTGYLLREAGLDPTLMNGGMLRNYQTAHNPYPCAFVGQGGSFVSEVDESDGSIAFYNPEIAVITNITLDHKPLAELRPLFAGFMARSKCAIVNADDPETAALTKPANTITFGLNNPSATLNATDIVQTASGISASVNGHLLQLQTPGQHNLQNALAAMAVGLQMGLPLARAAEILAGFSGISRRLEVVGMVRGITVLDDFAHNPDKIRATLATLKTTAGRLLVMFQPHGYGPLRLMHQELAATFRQQLSTEDMLFLPEPYYAGGTVDRSVGSQQLAASIGPARHVQVFADRTALAPALLNTAQPGDRIIIMGARDETLPDFAREILKQLA